jgi:DNA polymerase I-like protein with 3'-5' exonuclease and polymerase domains
MAGLIFDIECNGFLDTVTKVHCVAVMDEAGGEVRSFGGKTDEKIRNLLTHLEDAPVLIGHNIIEFDIPVLKKVYPSFNPKGALWDTLLDSQTIWPDLRDRDFHTRRKNPDFPAKMVGMHKLEAWGFRLGMLKGTYAQNAPKGADVWAEWSQEMQSYCEQDVRVNHKLYQTIRGSEKFSQAAHDCEMEFKQYLLDQEKEGFPFDVKAATELYTELAAERAGLEAELAGVFQPWTQTIDFTPKRTNKTKGYVAGVVFKKTKLVTFNPRSHKHIADRLTVVRGWKPEDFTETGAPATDADVLEVLGKQWPECATLARHAEVQKIIGMVAEGKSAYLKKVSPDGRLRGRVSTCGTVTGRCSHKEPNLGNIPRRSTLGKRVRKLFTTIPGYKLVGCDAKGLEIRMLAHFLTPFDGGKYAKLAVEGDPHLFHMELTGLPDKDTTKTFFYGWLYGAGDGKIGLIISKGAAAGKKLRLMFMKRFPALSKLKDAVSHKATMAGYIKGLDGRHIQVRAVYSSLNYLLQSAGALVIKEATCIFNRELRARGYYQSGVARMVVHVHDEWQTLVKEGHEEEIGKLAADSIRLAGEHFHLRCPLAGDFKSGATWGDTH